MDAIEWIAVDWGSSRLRAWAVGADGGVVAAVTSDQGAAGLRPSEFEAQFLDAIAAWLPLRSGCPIYACGMLGAKEGWVEAPYRSVPCKPLSDEMVVIDLQQIDARLYICPGLCQREPADVMRGEEVALAGLFALQPGFDGLVCLPGTHSKWVQADCGIIRSFQSFLTGELFALLGSSSLLRHSIDRSGGWGQEAFCQAIRDALDSPEQILSSLFSIRSQGLIADLTGAEGRARLSGTLIGCELAAVRARNGKLDLAVIIADGHLADLYQLALRVVGCEAVTISAREATLAGFRYTYKYRSEK